MFFTCCCTSDAPDSIASPSAKSVVVEVEAIDDTQAIKSVAELQEAEAPESTRELPDEQVLDPSVELPIEKGKEPTLAFDHEQQVRVALVQKLLLPMMTSKTGWPMSELALHAVKVKEAVSSISDGGKKDLVKWLFGVTKPPNTHRMLELDVHDKVMDLKVQGLSLRHEDLTGLNEDWRNSRRQEVADKSYVFGPGTELQRWVVGNDTGLPEKPVDTTGVRVHVMLPGNPRHFDGLLSLFGHLFATAHQAKSSQAGSTILKALKALLPETFGILDYLIVCEETQYRIVEMSGVLHHTLKLRWNLEGVEKRFGKGPRDMFRDSPMYTLFAEDAADNSSDSKRVAMKMVSGPNQAFEICLFTAQSGNLVWMTSDGKPLLQNGLPVTVPGRAEKIKFFFRVTDAKLPLAGFGCWTSSVDLPEMMFACDILPNPYPVVLLRCLEMGAFPLEWFWAPFFSGHQMRLLLMRFFQGELHWKDDEIHAHLVFQFPRFSYALKKILKAFSSKILDILFSPVDDDPLPAFLKAFGQDCANLERISS